MDNPDPTERTAPAADADVLGEAATNTGTLDELTGNDAADGDATGRPRPKAEGSIEDGSAAAGRDENQAGFLKDGGRKFSP
jgi:hypothetical protein